jgi:hypothetical protein
VPNCFRGERADEAVQIRRKRFSGLEQTAKMLAVMLELLHVICSR